MIGTSSVLVTPIVNVVLNVSYCLCDVFCIFISSDLYSWAMYGVCDLWSSAASMSHELVVTKSVCFGVAESGFGRLPVNTLLSSSGSDTFSSK